jgi:hypothetical protein
MVGRGGAIWTVSGTGPFDGTRVTARRVGGKPEVLGRETSDLNVAACFVTPDGGLWNAWHGDLKRLIDGRWEGVVGFFFGERTGKPIELSDRGFEIGTSLRVVGDAGPPWLLLDGSNAQLLRLTYGPDFKDPRLDKVKVVEGGTALKVHDAIPWAEGTLLLATDKGPRRLAIASGAVGPTALPDPGRPITSLAPDGLGRVWLGGEGLWMVDREGKLHDCGALPMIGRTNVVTLAADPGHRDGVIASLGARGVVFVRVAPGP